MKIGDLVTHKQEDVHPDLGTGIIIGEVEQSWYTVLWGNGVVLDHVPGNLKVIGKSAVINETW